MTHPLQDPGSELSRQMKEAGRYSGFVNIGYANTLSELRPGSTRVRFDDGHEAVLLQPFRLDGDRFMVAEVEGGLAEINLETRANRFVADPHCSVCFTEVRWPSHLDAAGRCKECQP